MEIHLSELPIAAIILANGEIIEWNRAAQQLFGWTAQEAIHQPISLLLSANQEALLQPYLSTNAALHNLKLTTYTRQGTHLATQCSAEMLSSKEHVSRYLLTFVGISSGIELNNQIFEQILSATPDLIMLFDTDGRLLYANQTTLTLWRATIQSVIGLRIDCKEWSANVPPRIVQQFWDVVETRQPCHFEVILTSPDWRATKTVYEYFITPMLSEDNTILAIDLTARNITHRYLMEEALRSSELVAREQKIQADILRDMGILLNSTLDLPSLINCVLDNVSRIVDRDATSIVLLENIAPENVYWRNYPSDVNVLFKENSFSTSSEVFQLIEKYGQPILVTDTSLDPRWQTNESIGWIRSYVGMPIRSHGRVIGILNIASRTPKFYNSSHIPYLQYYADQVAIAIGNAHLYHQMQQRAEELAERVQERTTQLQQAHDRLRLVDQLKTKFVQDLSHEIRTPLTNMQLQLFLLEEKYLPHDEHIAVMKNQIERLNTMFHSVSDFFEVAECDDRSNQLAITTNIGTLLNDVVSTYRAWAEGKNLELNLSIEKNIPLLTGCFVRYLHKAIHMIVHNAITYTEHGYIRLCANHDPVAHQIVVEVEDTGRGIDESEMPYVFERFYRGKDVGSSTIPGAGLGLSLVKEVVEMIHGRVEIDSHIGQGTTVRLYLPQTVGELLG